MIQAVSGEIRKQGRYLIKSNAGRPTRWRTDFIGRRAAQEVEDHPQAFLIEMDANSSIGVHFHQVDHFQVLLAGSGSLGGNAAPLIALHYVDHHTTNGPVNAGPYGLSIFTVRLKSDPGATHLQHRPGYQELLKPTKKRYLAAANIGLSTEPVLQNRSVVSLENVLSGADGSDGLGAYMLRLGAGMRTAGPDPGLTGGQFYLVLNGSLMFEGAGYPVWSVVYVAGTDAPLEVCAGPLGLETLVLNFSREQS